MEPQSEAHLIIRFKDFFQDSKGVVFYKIAVLEKSTKNSWEFNERYSTMHDIHKKLKSQYRGVLPEFPSKKWFGKTDKNFLSQRKSTLQTYFTNILNTLKIDKYPYLRNFFYNTDIPKPNAEESIPKEKEKDKKDNTIEKISDKANNNNVQNNTKETANMKQNDNIYYKQYPNEGVKRSESEVQNELIRRDKFKRTMERIFNATTKKFIMYNNDDVTQLSDSHTQDLKREQINSIEFDLKSMLLSSFSLPKKYEVSPALKLQENINNSSLKISMDVLAVKIQQILLNHRNSFIQISDSMYVSQKASNIPLDEQLP